eukprot:5791970-Prymnesium_polylepis.1
MEAARRVLADRREGMPPWARWRFHRQGHARRQGRAVEYGRVRGGMPLRRRRGAASPGRRRAWPSRKRTLDASPAAAAAACSGAGA